MANDFCHFFDAMMEKYTLRACFQASASPVSRVGFLQSFRGTGERGGHSSCPVHQEGAVGQVYRHQFRWQHSAEGLQEPAHPHTQDVCCTFASQIGKEGCHYCWHPYPGTNTKQLRWSRWRMSTRLTSTMRNEKWMQKKRVAISRNSLFLRRFRMGLNQRPPD